MDLINTAFMDTLNLEIIDTVSKVKLEQSSESIREWNKRRDILNGGCRGCFGICNLKMLKKTYYHEGKAEIYSEMLMFCFSIQFEEIDKDNDLNFICEVCIRRLRDAADFKRQLEDAQSALKNLLDAEQIAYSILPEENDYLELDEIEDAMNDEIEDCMKDEIKDAMNDEIEDALSDGIEDAVSDGIEDAVSDEIDLQKVNIKNIIENLTVKRLNILVTQQTEVERELNHIKSESHGIALSDEHVNNNTPEIQSEKKKPKKKKPKLEDYPFDISPTDLKCKICNAEFAWNKVLKTHMSVHYGNHVCETCGHLFATQGQLARHKTTHSKKLWPCKLCPDKKYKSQTSLNVHHKINHLGKDIYRCYLCDERFKDFPRRLRHLIQKHGHPEKQHRCKVCDKRFNVAGQLSKHVRNIHLKDHKFNCTECTRTYFSKSFLKNHMVTHSSERTLPCRYCKKRFKLTHTRKEHEKIHTGEKKYVCDLCNKAFTQKGTLKGHMSVHYCASKSNVGN